jgi:hypothetical protein
MKSRIVLLLAIVLLCTLARGLVAQEDTAPPRNAEPEKALINDLEAVRGARTSGRWIGVVCVPLDDAMRLHLKLSDGGLVVHSVVPGSPAAESGLAEHDILISAGGNALTSTEDLMNSVAAARDQPLELEWLHKGDVVTKSVQPAPRPREMAWSAQPPNAQAWSSEMAPDQVQRLKKWIERLEQGDLGGEAFRFKLLGPAMELDEGKTEFHGNLSVEISRENDEPARIKVRRGAETWELTEDNLDQLPEDLRAHVNRMLGKESGGRVFAIPRGSAIAPLVPGTTLPDMPEMMMPPGVQRQFEEMNRRMEEMLKELRELKQDEAEKEDVIDA